MLIFERLQNIFIKGHIKSPFYINFLLKIIMESQIFHKMNYDFIDNHLFNLRGVLLLHRFYSCLYLKALFIFLRLFFKSINFNKTLHKSFV